MIEQLLHIAAIGAASHRLFFNLFNLFWLLLSMTFNVIAETQCSCHLVLPTHGWHISVSIVLVSHIVSLRLDFEASMARFSKKNKPIQQIDQWKHSSTTKIYQDTCTLTQGRMAYSTSCSAVSREAWHLGQHHLSIKILCFGGGQKSTIFQGMLLLIPLHLQAELHFQFHLAMIWPQLPRSLPPQEVRGHFVACGHAWSFHRLRKLQPCGMLDEQGWLLIIAKFNTCYLHTLHTPGTRIVQTCCRRKSRIAYSSQCSYGALSHFHFWHLQIQRSNCTRQTRNWFPERLQACFQQSNVRCCHFPHGAQGVHHGTIHANVMFLWSLPQSYLGFHKLETAAKGTRLAASAQKLEMLSSVFLLCMKRSA